MNDYASKGLAALAQANPVGPTPFGWGLVLAVTVGIFVHATTWRPRR